MEDQTVTSQLSQTDGVFLAGRAPPVSRRKFRLFPGCSKFSRHLEAGFPSASHLAEASRLSLGLATAGRLPAADRAFRLPAGSSLLGTSFPYPAKMSPSPGPRANVTSPITPLPGVMVPLKSSILEFLLPMSKDVLWFLDLTLAPPSADTVDSQGLWISLSCSPPRVRAGLLHPGLADSV